MIPDWPLVARCLAIGLVISLLLILQRTDADEIARRLRQAWRLLAEAGPWLVSAVLHPWTLRGRRLPPAARAAATPAHPSVRPPGLPVDGRKLDGYEQRALDAITRDSWETRPGLRVRQQRGQR